ncbi:MAG: hypothetical protein HKN43_04895 [Rhodothermales bacterium]|nr:hypothetical protein [Rhodothermales bacterium]
MMKSIRSGLSVVGRKPGLVALIYAVNVFTALVIAVPLYIGLSRIVGPTGFGFDLAAGSNIVVWADIIESLSHVSAAAFVQVMWILPVVFLAKVVSSVGLINAIRDDGIRSFWPGVGQYGGRAIVLGLAYLLVTIVGTIGITILLAIGYSVFSGEVGTYRMTVYVVPSMFLIFFAIIDLFHDYSRIKLVKDEVPVMRCFFHGFAWPWRHRGSIAIYVFWYLGAAILLVFPTLLDTNMAASTIGGIVVLFLIQQVVMVLRSAVTVAWFGSEVTYYEKIDWSLAPMIAGDATGGESGLESSPAVST